MPTVPTVTPDNDVVIQNINFQLYSSGSLNRIRGHCTDPIISTHVYRVSQKEVPTTFDKSLKKSRRMVKIIHMARKRIMFLMYCEKMILFENPIPRYERLNTTTGLLP